jgi:hypothetical protein
MKKILISFTIILTVFISCTTVNFPKHPKWLCNRKYACLKHPKLEMPPIANELIEFYDNSLNDKTYEDFPNEDTTFSSLKYKNAIREGQILNGYKEGRWSSAIYKYDTVKKTKEILVVFTEEYFKRGLRDSIFRQFDIKGNLIYSTMFNRGTGLWKEFHGNRKIYFEIYTKDGYFTDTLRLHDYNGNVVGKRLYLKDSLIYSSGLPCFPYKPESVPSD